MLGFLLLLPWLWYGRELFTDAVLMTDDLIAQYQPWWDYARQRLESGEWPLWNPYVFCGMPYHINPENLLFYPLKIPLMLCSFFTGAAVLRVLHAMIASAGMFLLLRRLRLHAGAAAAGAVMFTYGSFMAYEFIHIPYVTTASWLPWELLALRRVLDRPGAGAASALAAAAALCFLGGSPGVFMIVQLMAAVTALFWLAAPDVRGDMRRLVKIFASGLFGAALFAALTAVLLWPAMQFVGSSPRAGGLDQVETFIRQSIQPALLRLLAWPALHWMNGAPYPPIYPMQVIFIPYVGILGALLALFGLLSRRGRDTAPALLACGALGVLLALGRHTGLFPALYHHLEIFRWFRWPHDYLLLTYAALSMLAAFGLDALAEWLAARPGAGHARMVFIGSLYGLFLLADLFLFGWGYRIAQSRTALAMEHLKEPLHFLADHAGHERVSVSSMNGHAYFRGQQAVFRSFPPHHADPDWLGDALPNLNAWCAARGDSSWRDFYDYRAAIHPKWDAGTRLYPINAAMLYGYQEICGYDPFMVARMAALLGIRPVEDVWNWCNVKYVATPDVVSAKHLTPVCSNAFLTVYENGNRLPRAFIPLRVRSGLNGDDIYALMREASFDPLAESLVEGGQECRMEALEPGDVLEPPMITDYRPEYAQIVAFAKKPALLVLHDVHDPGWKAYVDGRETPIWRVNYTFRGVLLPPGRHTVVFRYRPMLFYCAAAVSLAAWSGLLLFLIVNAARRKRRDKNTRRADGRGDAPLSEARPSRLLAAAILVVLIGAAVASRETIPSAIPVPDCAIPCAMEGEKLKNSLPRGTSVLELEGGGIRLYANTYWGYEITLPSATNLPVTLIARGTPAEGEYPLAAITVDHQPDRLLRIGSDDWTAHTICVPLSAGKHTLIFSFVNDYFCHPEDRNLDLRAIHLGGQPPE